MSWFGRKPPKEQPVGPPPTGPIVNGFHSIAEGPALSVRPERIAPYTLPVEVFTFEPARHVAVCDFKSGDRERKIYNNIDLDEDEKEILRKLRTESAARNLEFLPSITSMAGRFLSRARGDPSKAIKLMQATQDWRRDFFKDGPIVDDSVFEDLKYGIVYWCGRDWALRPTLVVRANRIPQQWYKEKRVDKLIRLLIFCMEYMLRYMVIPGRVENNCLIVDLKGLGISQVPLGALENVYKVMSHHYIGRVYRFYVCNLSAALSTLSYLAKGLLTDRQRQKIAVLDSVTELSKDWASHQLETDLGGSRPVHTEFYPFPLEAGPFEAGWTKGADPSAPRCLHTVLTQSSVQGKVWDASLRREDNTKLDLSVENASTLARNGVELSPALCGSDVCAAAMKEVSSVGASSLPTSPVSPLTSPVTTGSAATPAAPAAAPPGRASVPVKIISPDEFDSFCETVAKREARGHEHIQKAIAGFFLQHENACSDKMVTSDFPTFEIEIIEGSSRRLEKIDVILTLQKKGAMYHASHHATCTSSTAVVKSPKAEQLRSIENLSTSVEEEEKHGADNDVVQEVSLEDDSINTSSWWNCRPCCNAPPLASARLRPAPLADGPASGSR